MGKKDATANSCCEQSEKTNTFIKVLDALRERGYDYVNIVHTNGYIVTMWLRPVDVLIDYESHSFSGAKADDTLYYPKGFGVVRDEIASDTLPSDCSYMQEYEDHVAALGDDIRDRLFYALENNYIAYRHFGTSLSVYDNMVIANYVIKNSDTVNFAAKDTVINKISDYVLNTDLILSIIPCKYQSRFIIDDSKWIEVLREYEKRS